MVDPIPAFCDQLKKYEKECREWGYLTATDEVKASNTQAPKDKSELLGDKRKVNVEHDDNGQNGSKKSKMAGPMLPPQKSAPIGPAVGPATNDAIVPSIGPCTGPTQPNNVDDGNKRTDSTISDMSQKKRVIGPARPPPS